MKNLFRLMLVIAAITACAKVEEVTTPSIKTIIGYTDSDEATKTTLQNAKNIVWNTNDAIRAYGKRGSYESSKTTINASGSQATFEFATTDEFIYAAYPASAAASAFETVDGIDWIDISIPTEQTAVKGSFADNTNAAIAFVKDGDIAQFKNVGALLNVEVKNDNITAIKISASTQGEKGMTGQGSAAIDNNEAVSTICSLENDGVDHVELKGTFENGSKYYFVVFPGDYENIAIQFTNTSGQTATFNSSATLNLSRNANVKLFNAVIPDSKWVEGDTPATTHTVTFSVNGVVSTASVVEGSSVIFPTDITIPSGKVFIGWATAPIVGTQDVAPTTVTTATMGDSDVTYYAVFATLVDGPSKTVSLKATGLDTTSGYVEGTKNDSNDHTWTYYASIQNYSGTVYFGLNANEKNYNIGSPEFGGNISAISLKAYNGSSSADRKLLFCSSNTVAQPSSGDIAQVVIAKSEKFTKTYNVDLSTAKKFNQFYLYAPAALGVSEINVTYCTLVGTDYCTNVTVLSSIIVSGEPTTTTYTEGDVFNPAGLVVTGTYSDGSTGEISEGIEWTINPTTLTTGLTSCTVIATVQSLQSPEYTVNGLTVTAKTKEKKVATLSISNTFTSNGELTDDKDHKWVIESDGNYTGSTSYIQVGTNTKAVKYLKLSCEDIPDIEKIQVWGTSKASTNVTAKIFIDDDKIAEGEQYTTQNASSGGTETTTGTLSPLKTGDILIEISRPMSETGAIYFNKAIITYWE